jgi:hypothetical protein
MILFWLPCIFGVVFYVVGFVWYGAGKTTWGPVVLLVLGAVCFIYFGISIWPRW